MATACASRRTRVARYLAGGHGARSGIERKWHICSCLDGGRSSRGARFFCSGKMQFINALNAQRQPRTASVRTVRVIVSESLSETDRAKSVIGRRLPGRGPLASHRSVAPLAKARPTTVRPPFPCCRPAASAAKPFHGERFRFAGSGRSGSTWVLGVDATLSLAPSHNVLDLGTPRHAGDRASKLNLAAATRLQCEKRIILLSAESLVILGVRPVRPISRSNRGVPRPQFASDVTDKMDQPFRDETRLLVEGANQIVADKTKGIGDAELAPRPRDRRMAPLSDAARGSGSPLVERLGCSTNPQARHTHEFNPDWLVVFGSGRWLCRPHCRAAPSISDGVCRRSRPHSRVYAVFHIHVSTARDQQQV
jgi:hypothetical protein